MKWGIITDTHDKRDLVNRAIKIFESKDCSDVFHGGDFESDAIFKLFKKKSFRFHFVTDHEGRHDYRMRNRRDFYDKRVGKYNVGMFHDTYRKIKRDDNNRYFGVRIGIDSSYYAYFFYGHLHFFNLKIPTPYNPTTVINSGGFYQDDFATFCILDTDENVLDLYYWMDEEFYPVLRFDLKKPLQSFQCLDDLRAYRYAETLRKFRWEKSDKSEYAFTDDEDAAWFCKNYKYLFDHVGLEDKPAFFF